MGTPEFAVSSLEYLVLNEYQVVAVYTRPDKPAGRGGLLIHSPVKKAALAWNLPVVQVPSMKDGGAVARLADYHPDVIIVAAFGQILPQSVLELPGCGCINIHPSLLPRYRGASPIPSAILSGDKFTGVSIMLMDSGLDTGPVLSQAAISIASWDNTGSLTMKLSRLAPRLLTETLVYWLREEILPRPQNEDEATLCGQITKKDGEINWNLPAIDIWRRVRAFNPWPGCYTFWEGKQLKIIEALPLNGEEISGEGQVVVWDRDEAAFGVNTGDGILGVVEVQLEGKREMSAVEFLRGQREFVGSVLPG